MSSHFLRGFVPIDQDIFFGESRCLQSRELRGNKIMLIIIACLARQFRYKNFNNAMTTSQVRDNRREVSAVTDSDSG